MLQMDANTQRGEIAFNKSIEQEFTKINDEKVIEKLKNLQSHFKTKVGIMPTNGLYSASKLPIICVQASYELDKDLNESIARVDEMYALLLSGSQPTQRISNDSDIQNRGVSISGELTIGEMSPETIQLQKEIESLYGQDSSERKTIDVVSNGEDVGAFYVESIDMLEDASMMGELSVEGMRAMNLIGVDFDTTCDEVPEDMLTLMKERSEKPNSTNWYVNASGAITIYCPECKSESIYPAGNFMFGCFNCNKEFYFYHNLSDFS